MPEFRLSINGRDLVANVDAAAMLPLYFLRKEVDPREARLGRGLGQCGACAGAGDEVAARSRIYPSVRAIGRDLAKALERFKYRLKQDSTPSLVLKSPLDAAP